ncbi:MAG: MBOAT family O-acyltransferase [Flavobacteriales bacterium]
MLFNSFEFFFFLPAVFSLYWFVAGKSLKWQNILILLSSYFFYGWWSIHFLSLLFLSTLLDYCYGFGVASATRKKAKLFLWLSIVNNLGILGLFKYYDFFTTELQIMLAGFGITVSTPLLNIAIPVGLSFYTFHGMSYVFDIYRNKQLPVKNFVDYAVFVSFFPLLVAGPIERANHLLPQIQRTRIFKYSQAVDGCKLILWGMFKKAVLAYTLSGIADTAFEEYETSSALCLITGAIAFSFQIYCDFSGYSDIAIGTAKIFGFEILSNFRFPYFSRDIAEFWRRWHISLTSWFKTYVYIPLGGSGEGTLKAIRNTFIIFLLSGFWHGPKWNFIAWGFIHACAFLPLLLLKRNRKHIDTIAENSPLPSFKELMQMFVTFAFVTLAWIFFRADNLSVAVDYIGHIATSLYSDPLQSLSKSVYKTLLCAIIIIVADWQFRRNDRKLKIPTTISFLMGILIIYFMLYSDSDNNFIYFNF